VTPVVLRDPAVVGDRAANRGPEIHGPAALPGLPRLPLPGRPLGPLLGPPFGSLVRPLAVLGLLAVAVAVRYLALSTGGVDPIVIGFGFGIALAAIAIVGRVRTPAARAVEDGTTRHLANVARSLGIGLAGGGALIALALVGRAAAGSPPLPSVFAAGAFVPWALATTLVATGEEAVLRGALFSSLARLGGAWPAILLTSLAFALIHVPFYGWRVVPLDLGVGIWLAGLRLASGGIVAPSIAHGVADLATWWL
jgi:membrane protease YdiL (CAAX protease family)